MPNYQNGKIYAIRSHQTDLIYIGSTCLSLARRMTHHRHSYKLGQPITSSKILQYDDCYIELIENCACNNKEELNMREGQLIRERNCVNKVIPNRTGAEYYQDNREAIAAQKKAYSQANKEELNAKSRAYKQANKEAILAKGKEYHEANKETIAARKKAYYEANKEAISARRKELRELRKN